MRLKDEDIIKVHQTTKDFTQWFGTSIEALKKYTDSRTAHLLMQYSILEALDSVLIPDTRNPEKSNARKQELYGFILGSLKEEDHEESVREYFSHGSGYVSFMAEYRLDRYCWPKETGRFWIQLADSAAGDRERQKEFIDDLVVFVTWTYAYVREYAYQYLTEDVCYTDFNMETVIPKNYWKLKELEHSLDVYPEGMEEQEYRYHNREELLYDLVDQGVFLPDAVEITRRVRKGQGVTEEQGILLKEAGYDYLDKINSIKYLPSFIQTFEKTFRVNRLI